ncbi:hypothetical protein OG203_04240 [Nocardia sp. NBC_01499]|uniref:hypothetical protein n=1 Tax=Nocardia sp. NBC_01499 TaxID=2903597 RepID=UPI00386EA31C
MYKKLASGVLALGAMVALSLSAAGAAGAVPYIPGDPDYIPGSDYGQTTVQRPDGSIEFYDPSGHLIATRYPDGTTVSAGGNFITYPDGSTLSKGYASQDECQRARGGGVNLFPLFLNPCDYNEDYQFFYRTPARQTPPPTGSFGR